jgi:hypothetical protein
MGDSQNQQYTDGSIKHGANISSRCSATYNFFVACPMKNKRETTVYVSWPALKEKSLLVHPSIIRSEGVSEQRTFVAHVPEFRCVTEIDPFPFAKRDFLLVQPVVVPHRDRAEDDAVYCKRVVNFVQTDQLTMETSYAKPRQPMIVPWPMWNLGGSRYTKEEQTLRSIVSQPCRIHESRTNATNPPRLPTPTTMASTTPRLRVPPALPPAHAMSTAIVGYTPLAAKIVPT